MKEESRYMDVVNEVNKNHCLYIKPVIQQQHQSTKKKLTSPWKRICDDDDENCIGVDECNMFECMMPKTNGKSGKEMFRYKETMYEKSIEKYFANYTEKITPPPMEIL